MNTEDRERLERLHALNLRVLETAPPGTVTVLYTRKDRHGHIDLEQSKVTSELKADVVK